MYFLKYQKKRIHLCKANRISLLKIQKSHQNYGSSINNGLKSFANNFCYTSKIYEYGFLSYNVLVLHL